MSSMATQSPAAYGLLGMLAVRSWTGYELTRQVHRSLRFIWPTSEGHLYREQKRLVTLGWAVAEQEQTGQRTRNRYTITPAGREALAKWLATPPEEPHLQIEGVLRAFYANLGSPTDLHQTMTTTAEQAHSMLATLQGFVREYSPTAARWTCWNRASADRERAAPSPAARCSPNASPASPSHSRSPPGCWKRSSASSRPRPPPSATGSSPTPRPPAVAWRRSLLEQRKAEGRTPSADWPLDLRARQANTKIR